MMFKYNAMIAALALALAAGGCAGSPMAPADHHVCRVNCSFNITLPDPADLPTLPGAPIEPIRVAGGIPINIVLESPGNPGGVALLVFEDAALRSRQGQPWLYTVRLTPGRNSFTVRPHDAGVCLEPGCRFVVINLGRPDQPSLINSPVFIIVR